MTYKNKTQRFATNLKIDFCCSPRSFRLQAEENLSRRTITISFFVGEKEAHRISFRGTLANFGDEQELTKLTKENIERFMSQSDRYVKNHVDFLGQTVYTGLKEVRTKLGTLLWKR